MSISLTGLPAARGLLVSVAVVVIDHQARIEVRQILQDACPDDQLQGLQKTVPIHAQRRLQLVGAQQTAHQLLEALLLGLQRGLTDTNKKDKENSKKEF